MTFPGAEFRRRMMGQSETLLSIREFSDVGETQERLSCLRETYQVLCDFLESNGLTKDILYSKETGIGNDFVLRKDQLTKEGSQLFQQAAYEWMRGHDFGKILVDVSRLQRALNEIKRVDEIKQVRPL